MGWGKKVVLGSEGAILSSVLHSLAEQPELAVPSSRQPAAAEHPQQPETKQEMDQAQGMDREPGQKQKQKKQMEWDPASKPGF